MLNPALFRGQITGSVHMGLGYALSEELPQEGAGLPPLKLKDLGLVPMNEMPPVEVIGVEVPDPLGPYGAKGVGEVGLVPTAAAVAGAFNAFDGGARRALPLAAAVLAGAGGMPPGSAGLVAVWARTPSTS